MKKTSGYYHLSLNLHKLTIGGECDLIMGLNYATDPDVHNIPVTQAALQALVAIVRADLGTRVTDPHPTLTKTEQQHVDSMSRGLLGVASDVVRQANNVALGNKVVFETILRRIGFHPSKPKAKHVRIFESKSSGKGMIDIIVPVEKGLGNLTYVFQYGITTAENVLPAKWEDPIPLGSAEFYVSGLPSGIVAVHYAVLVIPSHKKTVSGTPTEKSMIAALDKMITMLPVNSKGKIVIMHGLPFYYFSDTIYVTVS